MHDLIIQKLRQGRNDRKLKQSEVAGMIGVKGNTLSNYENGVSEPDIDTFCKLCEIYHLDPASILNEAYGLSIQGEDIKIKPSEIEFIKKYRSLDDFGRDTVDWMIGREKERKDTEDGRRTTLIELPARIRQIPYFYKNASAGTGEIIFDNPPEERIEIPDTPENARVDYAIGVNGRSMEPLYNDGDILLVEIVQSIDVGEIGIFIKDEKSYVKQLGETELISINKEHGNITLDDTVRCMGKVVGKL